jgi:hypothetical protein
VDFLKKCFAGGRIQGRVVQLFATERLLDDAVEVAGEGHRKGRVNFEGTPEESDAGGFLGEKSQHSV